MNILRSMHRTIKDAADESHRLIASEVDSSLNKAALRIGKKITRERKRKESK